MQEIVFAQAVMFVQAVGPYVLALIAIAGIASWMFGGK